MGKKDDVGVFERDVLVGARRASLSILESFDLLGFFPNKHP